MKAGYQWGRVMAMTPRQMAACLHFDDRLRAHDEAAAIVDARLAAHGDDKVVTAHIKGLTRE